MDIKQSAKGLGKLVTSKPVLWGAGALVVLAGGYWFLTNSGSSSSSSASTGTATDSSVPIVYSSNGQVVADTSNGASSGTSSDYTQALVDLETQQAGYNYSATIAGLNSQTILGIVGAQTAQAAIASTNYQTSANTVQQFLKSGYNAITGQISGPDGAQTSLNLAVSTPGGKGSANNILTNFYNSTVSAQNNSISNTPQSSAPSSRATDATNQLVSASLSTLIHNGGLGVAA